MQGNLRPLCDFIETRLNVFSNRDYRYSDELAIKTAFLMLLFNDRLYVVDSEPELDRRYADLSLIARPDARQYPILDHVIEFKFVKLSDVHSNDQELTTFKSNRLVGLYPKDGSLCASELDADYLVKFFNFWRLCL